MHNRAKLGYFSLISLPPGEEASYNRWHRYDHMPEVVSVPGRHFGQRFLATPECLAARVAADGGFARAQYFTYYLFGEPIDKTLGGSVIDEPLSGHSLQGRISPLQMPF